MDNDLLDFLRRSMISGIGVPSQMLNYSDEMEFARSVSMQNGMFLRSIIAKQKKLTGPFNSMYRDLYENEFGTNLYPFTDEKEIRNKEKQYASFLKNNDEEIVKKSSNNTDNNSKDTVEIERITVKFPSPSALNATNLAEQINNGQTIVQTLTDIMFNQNGTVDEDHKHRFLLNISKKFMPNVDWDDIEEVYQSSRVQSTEDKIENKMYNPDQQ